MNERKQRDGQVTFSFDKPTAANGIKIYPDGRVELLMDGKALDPRKATSAVTYARPKGAKVLTQSSVLGVRAPTNPLGNLGNADRFYWVDTTTEKHRGQTIHATCVKIGEPFHGPRFTFIREQTAHGFEWRGDIDEPERLAWAKTIQRLRLNPQRLLNWHVVLVVDSALGVLPEINLGTEPVWGDYMLPPGFELLYASADVGKDLGLNAVMARCDRSAKALLKQIIALDPMGNGVVERSFIGGVPIRPWDPN